MLTPRGEVAIEQLRGGDTVYSIADGQLTFGTVRGCFQVSGGTYHRLRTAYGSIYATDEHPFMTGRDRFCTASLLRVGQGVYLWRKGVLELVPLLAVDTVVSDLPAYNLQVFPGQTFIAGGMVVHNKGGGCFPAGTKVRTPEGLIAIEDILPGQCVLGIDENGRVIRSIVRTTFQASSALLVLKTDLGELRTTVEHPVMTAGGCFIEAGGLRTHDEIMVRRNDRLMPATIQNLRASLEKVRVFNLQVGPPHTFLADDFVVHNKGGGCFPAGTRIRTADGTVAIEDILPGRRVLCMNEAGRITETTVRTTYQGSSLPLVIETDQGELRTTVEHPLLTDKGSFVEAGGLTTRDKITVWRNNRFITATIQNFRSSPERVRVFNLQVGPPHTFLADDFVVHNKGGGFHGGGYHGSRHSSGGGSGSSMPPWIPVVIIVVVAVIVLASNLPSRAEQNLDYVYSTSAVGPKAEKTRKLLEFIQKQDPSFNIDVLSKTATGTFIKLQGCWQARDYGPMKGLLMPDLYKQHCQEITGMVNQHTINILEGLAVKRVDIVNVRYTNDPDQREYTALITAKARDYYVDDRTFEFTRGDSEAAEFQEFWTFQLQKGQWILREIEQTRESDILKDENFFEPFTERNVDQVYGEAAGKAGPAGPWLESGTQLKSTRIDRLLNFLVKTDKLWNRQLMVERARQVFLSVYHARECGGLEAVKDDELFPDVAQSLRERISDWQNKGITVEFRNICIRKAELILVRNYADNRKDEFTVRISAHVQQVVSKGGQVRSMDDHVIPFEEYWTFGRLDNQWKLKEILPAAKGRKELDMENYDEESSLEQLQWYYRQPRSN